MAKRFAGFTPEQMGKIVPEMAGMQGDEQTKFLAANPAAAARVGKMAELAQKRIGMAYGGMVKPKGYAVGGIPLDILNKSPLIQNEVNASLPSSGTMRGPDPSMNARQDLNWNPSTGKYEPVFSNFNPISSGTMLNASSENVDNNVGLIDLGFGPRTDMPFSEPTQEQLQSRLPRPNQMKLDAAQQAVATAQQKLQDAIAAQQAKPDDKDLAEAVNKAQAEVNSANQRMQSAQSAFNVTEVPTAAETTATAMRDPMSLVQQPEVKEVPAEDKAAGQIAEGTGQIDETAPQATQTEAGAAPEVAAPETAAAATVEAVTAQEAVQATMDKLTAATGKPSDEALAEAATMSPEQLAQLGLSAAQIAQAQQVQAPTPREVQAGEMIAGSTVDMARARAETNFAAATGSPSTDATVQGQLTSLMEQFEGNEPPAWAAGAMRAAAAKMAARGLSASSMAGQAVVQAAMESALPVAQADAATFARFEAQNLSNRQQAAMFAAEKRAEFLGLEFNQEFQARVANAAKISDIANMNFTAEQQVALENARLANSVDMANLNAANAKVLADAAAMTQLDITNLNNRQQAQVQNAKAFLDMDMTNLNNEQQTAMFKSQTIANTLLSDAAAQNAARQFNATSENQTNQFFANLASKVAMHNNAQANETARFNAGEANAISTFNATAQAARDQFNAEQGLVIAQANAAWAQKTTTIENAAKNQSNRDAAMAANNFTMTAYNNTLQLERDVISYAWRTAESQMDRENAIRLQLMANSMKEAEIQAEIDKAKGTGTGKIINTIVDAVINKWL